MSKTKCYDCGLKYGGEGWIEAVIPDKIWNRISPTGDQGGILCINCISQRLSERGFKDVPVWLCGTEPLTALQGDPGNYIDILRTWDVYIRKEDREKYFSIHTQEGTDE